MRLWVMRIRPGIEDTGGHKKWQVARAGEPVVCNERIMLNIDLVLYYLKYRECNPQVLELMIESFKMGTLVE